MTKDCKIGKILLIILCVVWCLTAVIAFIGDGLYSAFYMAEYDAWGVVAGVIIPRFLNSALVTVSFGVVLWMLICSLGNKTKKASKVILIICGCIYLLSSTFGELVSTFARDLFLNTSVDFDYVLPILSQTIFSLSFVSIIIMLAIMICKLFFEKYEYVLMCIVSGVSIVQFCLEEFVLIRNIINMLSWSGFHSSHLLTCFDFVCESIQKLIVVVMYCLIAYILIRIHKNECDNGKNKLEGNEELKALGEDNAEV